MISSLEFKKQISKPLGKGLRELGFKGSGFHYRNENEAYYFAIGVQGSNYGDKCYVELGIQPKFLEPEKIDPKKYKYYDCELRTRIGNEWPYSNTEHQNVSTANQILKETSTIFEPIYRKLTEQPNFIEKLELNTTQSINLQISKLLNGFLSMTTEARLTWMIFEFWKKNNDVRKAVEVAKFGLKELNPGNPFFARNEYLKYLDENNRA